MEEGCFSHVLHGFSLSYCLMVIAYIYCFAFLNCQKKSAWLKCSAISETGYHVDLV